MIQGNSLFGDSSWTPEDFLKAEVQPSAQRTYDVFKRDLKGSVPQGSMGADKQATPKRRIHRKVGLGSICYSSWEKPSPPTDSRIQSIWQALKGIGDSINKDSRLEAQPDPSRDYQDGYLDKRLQRLQKLQSELTLFHNRLKSFNELVSHPGRYGHAGLEVGNTKGDVEFLINSMESSLTRIKNAKKLVEREQEGERQIQACIGTIKATLESEGLNWQIVASSRHRLNSLLREFSEFEHLQDLYVNKIDSLLIEYLHKQLANPHRCLDAFEPLSRILDRNLKHAPDNELITRKALSDYLQKEFQGFRQNPRISYDSYDSIAQGLQDASVAFLLDKAGGRFTSTQRSEIQQQLSSLGGRLRELVAVRQKRLFKKEARAMDFAKEMQVPKDQMTKFLSEKGYFGDDANFDTSEITKPLVDQFDIANPEEIIAILVKTNEGLTSEILRGEENLEIPEKIINAFVNQYRAFQFEQGGGDDQQILGQGVCHALNFRWIMTLMDRPMQGVHKKPDLDLFGDAVTSEDRFQQAFGSISLSQGQILHRRKELFDRYFPHISASDHVMNRLSREIDRASVGGRDLDSDLMPVKTLKRFNVIQRKSEQVCHSIEDIVDLAHRLDARECPSGLFEIIARGSEDGHALGMEIDKINGVFSFWDVNYGFWTFTNFQQMKACFSRFLNAVYVGDEGFSRFFLAWYVKRGGSEL